MKSEAEPKTERLLRILGELRPGSSLCPGELARRLGETQASLRPLLATLAAEGRVRITQSGADADLASLRGPYRVASSRR